MPTSNLNGLNGTTLQPKVAYQYHVSLETTNKSFIDMYYYLISIGIPKDHADFMLRTYDPTIIGVDPFDPSLNQITKAKIAIECGRNIWYFLRECVRVNTPAGKTRYQLHRANMAETYLFERNFSVYTTQPRQFGKTVGTNCCMLWIYNFGAKNSTILYYHKDHGGAKDNLKGLKELRDNLPDYLQMKADSFGISGKKVKVPNTVETATNIITGDRIVTLPSARSKDQADKIARGRTCTFMYFDEFAFMPYNQIVYSAAYPAYSTASRIAAAAGAHYGVIISTTPGDLTTDEGIYAYNMLNNATPWSDYYYSLDYQKLYELKASNTNSNFFNVTFTYQQLGRGDDYLKEMVIGMNKDWPKIRREVLLEWAQASDNSPFDPEDLAKIKDLCRDPIRQLHFGRHQQYTFNVYEDIDLRYPPIMGVDVSGALYNDSSAITIIDSRTTRVVADFNCNYIPADDLADLIYTIITKFMPNAVCVIERNGGFGLAVLQRLCKTSIKKNLYYEIKDKVIEESFNGVHLNRRKARVKVYGCDSTKEVRARMIELLYERVNMHKDKFISKILQSELETLEVDKRGKVQAIAPHHDDQIFSYLHAIRVWYDGTDLAGRYGIQKNTIRTDEDVEIEENTIEQQEELKKLDLDTVSRDTSIVTEQLETLQKAQAVKLQSDYNKETYDKENEELNIFLSTDGAFREAYNKKYNVDSSVPGQSISYIDLPDNVFGTVYDDTEDLKKQQEKELHGNLFDKFNNL